MNRIGIAALAVMGLLGVSWAGVSVVELNGHYYQYVNIAGLSWDQAEAQASGMSYLGLNGHLATLNTQAEYTFVNNYLNTVGSSWDLAAVGGRNVAGTYTWINGEGAMNFAGWSSSPWYTDAGDPQAGNYGVAMGNSDYNNSLLTQHVSMGFGDMLVEYQAVPEPSSLLLLAVGCAAIVGRRRVCTRG